MRSLRTCLLLLVMLCGTVAVASAAEKNFEKNEGYALLAITEFFNGLKSGDAAKLESSISGKLLENRQVLLTQNPQYPAFLESLYQNAEFRITQVNVIDETHADVFAEVRMTPDEPAVPTKYRIEKVGLVWKVAEEDRIE